MYIVIYMYIWLYIRSYVYRGSETVSERDGEGRILIRVREEKSYSSAGKSKVRGTTWRTHLRTTQLGLACTACSFPS